MSAFGDLKYAPDFKHFDYVNPNAPRGSVFSQVGSNRVFNQNFLTFNSLNIFILKGDGAQGMELTFAGLMARAADEPDALYGLAARAVRVSGRPPSHYGTLHRPSRRESRRPSSRRGRLRPFRRDSLHPSFRRENHPRHGNPPPPPPPMRAFAVGDTAIAASRVGKQVSVTNAFL